jgi:hypothetical protein
MIELASTASLSDRLFLKVVASFNLMILRMVASNRSFKMAAPLLFSAQQVAVTMARVRSVT